MTEIGGESQPAPQHALKSKTSNPCQVNSVKVNDIVSIKHNHFNGSLHTTLRREISQKKIALKLYLKRSSGSAYLRFSLLPVI